MTRRRSSSEIFRVSRDILPNAQARDPKEEGSTASIRFKADTFYAKRRLRALRWM